jgi:hypothetical protein
MKQNSTLYETHQNFASFCFAKQAKLCETTFLFRFSRNKKEANLETLVKPHHFDATPDPALTQGRDNDAAPTPTTCLWLTN